MRPHPAVAAIALAATLVLAAHTGQPAAPAGHWEGVLEIPDQHTPFEIDLAERPGGGYEGTLGIPAQKVRGLPLAMATIDGTTVTFGSRSDRPFVGTLASDGASLVGTFTIDGFAVPVRLVRSGEATIDPPPSSAPIGEALVGTWDGTLEVNGTQSRLRLTMANHADGTASGTVVQVDAGGLTLPVTIVQHGSHVIIETTAIPSAFSGTLDDDGTALAGTFRQGPLTAAVRFLKVER